MQYFFHHTRRPDITFHSSGQIDITARIARQLALSPGDVIDLVQLDSGEVCIFVRSKTNNTLGRHRGRCYPVIKSNKKGSYRLWSKRLTAALFELAECNESSLRLACGMPLYLQNKIYIPLIYKLQLIYD